MPPGRTAPAYVPPEQQQPAPQPGLGGGGLMSPADYNAALFLGPEGYPPPQPVATGMDAYPSDSAGMYAAPVEQQYLPGGDSYLPPYQPPAPTNPYGYQAEPYGPSAQLPPAPSSNIPMTPYARPTSTPFGSQPEPYGGRATLPSQNLPMTAAGRAPMPMASSNPLDQVGAIAQRAGEWLGVVPQEARAQGNPYARQPQFDPRHAMLPGNTPDRLPYYSRQGQIPPVYQIGAGDRLPQQPTFARGTPPISPVAAQEPAPSGGNWWDGFAEAAGNILPAYAQFFTPGMEPDFANSVRDTQDVVGGMLLEDAYPKNRAGLAGRDVSENVFEPFVENIASAVLDANASTNPYLSSKVKSDYAAKNTPAAAASNPYQAIGTAIRSAGKRGMPAPTKPAGTAALPPENPMMSQAGQLPQVTKLKLLDTGQVGGDTANITPADFQADREAGFAHVLMTDTLAQQLADANDLPLADLKAAVGRLVAVPKTWLDATGGTEPVTNPVYPATSDSGSSGSGGGGGSNWVEYGRGGSSGGWSDWGSSSGTVAPETFFAEAEGLDIGDDDPFAAMRDNPLFARYFAVLEARYGRDGAMRRLSALSRRFRFRSKGTRSKNARSKVSVSASAAPVPSGESGVPTNAGIRKDVSKRVKKAT